jgi:hypothetical protein
LEATAALPSSTSPAIKPKTLIPLNTIAAAPSGGSGFGLSFSGGPLAAQALRTEQAVMPLNYAIGLVLLLELSPPAPPCLQIDQRGLFCLLISFIIRANATGEGLGNTRVLYPTNGFGPRSVVGGTQVQDALLSAILMPT